MEALQVKAASEAAYQLQNSIELGGFPVSVAIDFWRLKFPTYEPFGLVVVLELKQS